MYNNLHIHINFCWESWANGPSAYFKDMYNVVNLAYMHKLNVFYSKTKLQSFIDQCNDLDENFVESDANKIDLILENAIILREEISVFDVEYAYSLTQLKFREDVIITKQNIYNKNALVSINDNKKKLHLLAVVSNEDFCKVDLNIVCSEDDLIQWIVENINKRIFNLSPKHGENGKGNWKGESVLLCNKTTAQHFLTTAIGDFSKLNRLFNFDQEANLYIEFFYEGDNPQNQWHGFHVGMDSVKKRVPEAVRNYYTKKYNV